MQINAQPHGKFNKLIGS